MALDNNNEEEIDIELEQKSIKDLIETVDCSNVKIKDYKDVTEFISGIMTSSYKFPVIISSKDNKSYLINEDKIKALAMFLDNRFNLDEKYTNLHYDEGYACDFPEAIIKSILEKSIDIIYIKDSEFSKDVMDNLAKELNYYPYPLCIKPVF